MHQDVSLLCITCTKTVIQDMVHIYHPVALTSEIIYTRQSNDDSIYRYKHVR